MRAAQSHHETRPGGESTNSTLVSLYLILLSFFIAMQAILGADPLPFASEISPQSQQETGARIALNGQGAQSGVEDVIIEDVRALIQDYPGLRLTSRDNGLVLMEVDAKIGFFFGPDAVEIRLDRLELLQDLAAIAAQAQWQLVVFLPKEDELKSQRLHAFEASLRQANPGLGYQGGNRITIIMNEARDA